MADPPGDASQLALRSRVVTGARRVVVKVGTAVLTRDGRLAHARLYAFAESVAALRRQGREVLIVSSGAVGLGAERLGLGPGPHPLGVRQACAAVGQGRLMALWSEALERLGITAAQLLLTQDDFADRARYLNLRRTIGRLLAAGVIPVINENDTVSTAELRPIPERAEARINFGDNDKLSALVASKVDADLLILLTDVDGLYTADPRTPGAELLGLVPEVTPELEAGAGGPRMGTGGMRTKVLAARIAARSGCASVIANGTHADILDRIVAGESVGTLVLPNRELSDRRRWIAFATNVRAAVVVNAGASRALFAGKASLLPVGLLEVRGQFDRGDVVSVVDEAGREIARGIVNYGSDDARRVLGLHSDRATELLGVDDAELMRRDNIAMLEDRAE
jgi:glutamate 5-kinase